MTLAADAFRALATARVSCKRFEPHRTIPKQILDDILTTTMVRGAAASRVATKTYGSRAPSSFNLQPTQIVMVTDERLKEALSRQAMVGSGNAYRCRDCSALAVFLSDLEATKRIPRIAQLEADWGRRHPNYLAILPVSTAFMLGEGHAATLLKQAATGAASHVRPMPLIEPVAVWAAKNTALLVQQYVLAATSHGLATALMEGLDPRRLREALDVPDRYGIPMVAATGYEWAGAAAVAADPTPRLGLEEAVFHNRFGVGWTSGRPDDGRPLETNEDDAALL